MADRYGKCTGILVSIVLLAVLSGPLLAGRGEAPVFGRGRGGLVPLGVSRPAPGGAGPRIFDFDRPSLEGRARTLESSRRRMLGAPAVDTWRTVLVRVSFETDRSGGLTSMRTGGGFDLGPGDGFVIDPPPHDRAYFDSHMEALDRYYEFQSCGAVDMTWDILPEGAVDSYTLSDPADYGPGSGGQWTTRMLVAFVHDAIVACDEALSAQGYPVRLSDYDAIVLAHAGANLQSDVLGNSPNDIPSFYARLGDTDAIAVEGGSHLITELSVIPETSIQDGYNGGIAAVLAHEFGHQLGLPDLYDIYTNQPSIGVFDNMDSGGQLGAWVLDDEGAERYIEGFIPSGLSAWSRAFLGWIDVDTVSTFEESIPLSAAEKCPATAVRFDISTDEYYLVENRAAEIDGIFTGFVTDEETGVILGPGNCMNCAGGIPEVIDWEFTNGYDLLLPTESPSPGPDGGPGLLVWHVDEYFIERRWEDNEVNSRWPFGVSLVEASGVVDLGDPASRYGLGWYDDAFYEANATGFSESTLPPAWSNWLVPTGASMEGVSKRDTLMTFGAGTRGAAACPPVPAGARPLPEGVLALPGSFEMLMLDGNGDLWATGSPSPVFSAGEEALTPLTFAPSFDALTGEDAVLIAGRGGNLHAVRISDWTPCTGEWPVEMDTLATHPVIAAAAGGVYVAVAEKRGILHLLDNEGSNVGGTWDVGEEFVHTGNLVVRRDGGGSADGVFAASRKMVDPGGIWLSLYDMTAEGLDPAGEFTRFIPLTAGELAGELWMAGGDAVPHLEGAEIWVVAAAGGRAMLHGGGGRIAERKIGKPITAPPAIADLNGDGRLDLVCTDGRRVLAIDPSGANLRGWPRDVNDLFYLPVETGVSAAPTVAVVSGEMLVAAPTDAGILFLLGEDGEPAGGWPRKAASSFTGPVEFSSRGEDALMSWTDLVFNDGENGFHARRDEGGRSRWRKAPLGGLDEPGSWNTLFGDPGRTSFALPSSGVPVEEERWTDIESNLVVYPNPSSGERVAFHFDAPLSGEARLRIMTLTGETVHEERIDLNGGEAEFAVSMEGKAAGVYICRIVVSSSGRTAEAVRKFAIVN